MLVRFWGTRGSLPKPGPTTVRYGGNTSCVELLMADGTLFVLDCGTGAHGLGQALIAKGGDPIQAHLFLTHTHWDHIQGFPFFAPLFMPGNEWDIYAPESPGRALENVLAGQMEYEYFPVTLEELGATIRCHDLVEGTIVVGSVRIRARYLNHPALTLAYRFEAGGAAVVYSTDHEPHSRYQAQPESPRPEAPVHLEDRRHIEFLAGADLVIHDAQYTAAEYPQKVGWGHSTVEYAVDVAAAAGARRLALYHHDPLRDDDAVDQLVEACRRRAAAAEGGLEVFAAAEGLAIEIPEREGAAMAPSPEPERRGHAGRRADDHPRAILIADDDPDILGLLEMTLRAEGFRLLKASDGETALRTAQAEHPDLLLVDWQMPGPDGLEICRALRANPDPRLRDVPIVLLTAQSSARHIAEGFAAGATDYLTKPFAPAHVRSRVRGWLLRTGASRI